MKRVGGLWPGVISFDNLLQAFRQARRGKRDRPAVALFELQLERNLFALQDELASGDYQPGSYRQFTIYERKPRCISAAPFRDRVVHHALMNRVEPLLDRTFIDDSYACRRGRGVHAAVARYQGWARRYRYVLKLDVSRYFPSIDHRLLKAKLRRRIKDQDVLWLFDRIIDCAPVQTTAPILFPGDDLITLMEHPRGLPIGNLTSQIFGNLYLDALDHHLKEGCRAPAYLRYVDDMVLLSNDKAWLWRMRDEIEAFLASERLLLHPLKQQVMPTAGGVDLLGYRVYPDYIRLRRDNGYRFRRRLRGMARAYAAGQLTLPEVTTSVAAWLGHIRHADSEALCSAVLSEVSFTRAGGQTIRASCAARRLLEQQSEEPAFGQPQQEQCG